jgi:hypothetical protein
MLRRCAKAAAGVERKFYNKIFGRVRESEKNLRVIK